MKSRARVKRISPRHGLSYGIFIRTSRNDQAEVTSMLNILNVSAFSGKNDCVDHQLISLKYYKYLLRHVKVSEMPVAKTRERFYLNKFFVNKSGELATAERNVPRIRFSKSGDVRCEKSCSLSQSVAGLFRDPLS